MVNKPLVRPYFWGGVNHFSLSLMIFVVVSKVQNVCFGSFNLDVDLEIDDPFWQNVCINGLEPADSQYDTLFKAFIFIEHDYRGLVLTNDSAIVSCPLVCIISSFSKKKSKGRNESIKSYGQSQGLADWSISGSWWVFAEICRNVKRMWQKLFANSGINDLYMLGVAPITGFQWQMKV